MGHPMDAEIDEALRKAQASARKLPLADHAALEALVFLLPDRKADPEGYDRACAALYHLQERMREAMGAPSPDPVAEAVERFRRAVAREREDEAAEAAADGGEPLDSLELMLEDLSEGADLPCNAIWNELVRSAKDLLRAASESPEDRDA